MLAGLRDLDPRQDREGAAAGREVEPCGLGVAMPAEPPQGPRPLGRDAGHRPWRIRARGICGPPRRWVRVSVGAAAVVGPGPRRPPRDGFIASGPPARASAGRVRGRSGDRLEAGLEAGQGLVLAAAARERPTEAREVTGRQAVPPRAIRVLAIDMTEESCQRANVLVVVANDVDERSRVAVPQEREVPLRDLPAGHVGVAADAEQRRFHGRQSGIDHPVAEQPADQRQQVEVAGVERRLGAGEAVAGNDQRPVEPSTVVGDEPAVARDVVRQLSEQGRLVGVIREQELELPEATALPPAEADEEAQRARGRGEPRRLGIEAEEGSVGGGLPRQAREPIPVQWQERRRRLDPDE
jgi:hypothetical protein